MVIDEGRGLSTPKIQQYDPTSTINVLRREVGLWRASPEAQWNVTPETARLLKHWRDYDFSDIRPFFCQVEAVETVIWLTEVAPQSGRREVREILERLDAANEQSNPDLARLALKLATGAGKTTVMAMLIAWQTVNAVRRPTSRNFTRGFLVVTPGLTIRDRLRVLKPNDPESYYEIRELVPRDMLQDLEQARIVITNYHAFKLRETLELSKGGRALLQGRGPEIESIETEGQMLQRVMRELMGMRSIMAFNDEAHHCYREKPDKDDEGKLTGDDRREAEKNREAARLWISGLEAVNRKLGLRRVVDLSATPFFLRGSGYAEGTLFPWTMCDFSLMDAIECGIVKLPRVPVADNIPGTDVPLFRNLWDHIRPEMPRKGRGQAGELDPLRLPIKLQTALEALYGHYAETFELWENAGVEVPPCFIVVCNNTATSKLVYDYIAGFERANPDGSTSVVNGRLELFQNFNEHLNPRARPRTLLIDSQQLESGEGLDRNFRQAAAAEIEHFRRAEVQRTEDRAAAEKISEQDLLREVMNTVGKQGQLGGLIRCVVSVSMLTEGWDANTVTHVLGVRAFGTQLLCEQVIGRALRRQSYNLNEDKLFDVEYADVLGIPFDFTAKPVVAKPTPPRETVQVRAVSPDRDDLAIRFPRVQGYRVELPNERLEARFNDESTFVLTPKIIGPTRTRNEGIIGEGIDLSLVHTGDLRRSTLLFHLTRRLLETKWRDPGDDPELHLFGQLKRITRPRAMGTDLDLWPRVSAERVPHRGEFAGDVREPRLRLLGDVCQREEPFGPVHAARIDVPAVDVGDRHTFDLKPRALEGGELDRGVIDVLGLHGGGGLHLDQPPPPRSAPREDVDPHAHAVLGERGLEDRGDLGAVEQSPRALYGLVMVQVVLVHEHAAGVERAREHADRGAGREDRLLGLVRRGRQFALVALQIEALVALEAGEEPALREQRERSGRHRRMIRIVIERSHPAGPPSRDRAAYSLVSSCMASTPSASARAWMLSSEMLRSPRSTEPT